MTSYQVDFDVGEDLAKVQRGGNHANASGRWSGAVTCGRASQDFAAKPIESQPLWCPDLKKECWSLLYNSSLLTTKMPMI